MTTIIVSGVESVSEIGNAVASFDKTVVAAGIESIAGIGVAEGIPGKKGMPFGIGSVIEIGLVTISGDLINWHKSTSVDDIGWTEIN